MKVLVFNCGSSSIKYKLFEMPAEELLCEGVIQRIGQMDAQATQQTRDATQHFKGAIPDYTHGFETISRMLLHPGSGVLRDLREVEAVGHRVVHGGERFTGSVRVDDELEAGILACIPLAPLHNPANLEGIRTAREFFGNIPMTACFDTAFHQTLPEKSYLYALPPALYRQYGIRRYGFHGISHRYVARRYAQMVHKRKYEVNVISCHLGNGSSICAIRNGRAVDTSMGLTPLEGLVMGTRCGDIDPEIPLFLEGQGYSRDEVKDLLNKKSGLLGLSGISNDVRDLEVQMDSGNQDARRALEIFAYRLQKYISAYLGVLNGADAIVLTGGIGEKGAAMRARIFDGLDWLGIRVDLERNTEVNGSGGFFQARDSRVDLVVIPTDEELAIARDSFEMANRSE